MLRRERVERRGWKVWWDVFVYGVVRCFVVCVVGKDGGV